ncbi:MAG: hypothetical protein LBU05_02055 [Bifidobacteriaceae bacterium]|jgi:hypothetical protein|nr:hypothetical protein [Bifidobacteriaceae bacterium]
MARSRHLVLIWAVSDAVRLVTAPGNRCDRAVGGSVGAGRRAPPNGGLRLFYLGAVSLAPHWSRRCSLVVQPTCVNAGAVVAASDTKGRK